MAKEEKKEVSKGASIINELLPGEMTPEDARPYFERSLKVLADMTEDTKMSNEDRIVASKGVLAYYDVILHRSMLDSTLHAAERSSNRLTDEVKKHRKPYEED
jgi:hypothetical protein